jgi:hypothetical protein
MGNNNQKYQTQKDIIDKNLKIKKSTSNEMILSYMTDAIYNNDIFAQEKIGDFIFNNYNRFFKKYTDKTQIIDLLNAYCISSRFHNMPTILFNKHPLFWWNLLYTYPYDKDRSDKLTTITENLHNTLQLFLQHNISVPDYLQIIRDFTNHNMSNVAMALLKIYRADSYLYRLYESNLDDLVFNLLKTLSNSDKSLLYRTEGGDSAFILACKRNDTKLINVFLDKQYECIFITNKKQLHGVCYLIENKNYDMINKYLEILKTYLVKIDSHNQCKLILLQMLKTACINNNIQVITKLLNDNDLKFDTSDIADVSKKYCHADHKFIFQEYDAKNNLIAQ